ncbi:MAG TPA: nucleotidyltransferase domain-containing protein [Luteolibacter sp.]
MSGNPSLPEAQRDCVVQALAMLAPAAIYLFGSVAAGTARPDSDLDLAVLPGVEADPMVCFQIANRLAEFFGREVDLVDLSRASTVLAKEVLRTGVLLGDARPNDRREFEMQTLSDYARLNEERQPVLAALR